MTAALWAFALAQFLFFSLVGWVVGDWLVRAVVARGGGERNDHSDVAFDWPERALLAFIGFVLFAVTCMVANIVLGGVVFGVPGVVPVAGAALVALRWRRLDKLGAIPWRALAFFVVPLVAVWMLPVLLSGTAARTGDIPWHLGWTEQLLSGLPVPVGPAPAEVAANAYPWGFHAILATLVRLVPGSDVMSALVTLQFVLILAVPLGAACLARRVVRSAGWGAAAATGFIGGVGWLLWRFPAFVSSPSEASHGADLVAASPNTVYELFPPPLPREVGLVLLAGAAVALGIGVERRYRRVPALAGVILGCAGLVSVPALVAGVVWTLAAALVAKRGSSLPLLARVLLPAAFVFSFWAGPVVRHLILDGAFVNVSPTLGREWPLWTSLAAWGVLGPLAALGVLAGRGRPGWKLMAPFSVATAILLGLAVARGEFEWALAGNATVLHQGRIWPIAHLLAGAFGGIGLWWLWNRMQGAGRAIKAVSFAALTLAGAASPALASVSLTEAIVDQKDGYPYRSEDLDEGSFVRRVAERLDPEDTLLVEGPPRVRDSLAFHIFSFSGVRLAEYDDPRLDRNDLRIRYSDLAREWDRTTSSAGYEPDYVIAAEGAEAPGEEVDTGDYGGRTWILFTGQ